MKTFAMLGLLILLCGCSTLSSSKGGAIGAVQTFDDQLAAKYGVPQSVVDTIRKTLGVVDTRTLPDSSRVLPAGYTWKQDWLDAQGNVVDFAKFHKGLPYVVAAGPVSTAVTAEDLPEAEDEASAALIGIIKAIQANPELLKAAE